MNLSDFLHMGGYAGYVWSAFGIATVVLVANVIVAKRQFSTNLEHQKRRLSHEENPS
jgi:heme exporter protein D